ncbi:MAG: HEAT repeat domain-containing protein [Cellulomonas sp.]
MTSGDHTDPGTRLRTALHAESSSERLQSALAAGTSPDPLFVEVLVQRCAVEPNFFVRDMLTWALTRHSSSGTVPRLLDEVRGGVPQARSQALHTLSKIGDPRGWSAITTAVLHDAHDEVARSAWRAAAALVPAGHEAELATELCTQLGRGDLETQRSLSRALVALGDVSLPTLQERATHDDPAISTHAIATERLLHDPDEGFEGAVAEAKRAVALASSPRLPPDDAEG